MKDGFVKVAAVSPVIKVADAHHNAARVIECMRAANEKGVKVLGIGCGGLIHSPSAPTPTGCTQCPSLSNHS